MEVAVILMDFALVETLLSVVCVVIPVIINFHS